MGFRDKYCIFKRVCTALKAVHEKVNVFEEVQLRYSQTGLKRHRYLKGYSKSTSIFRSLSDLFLHSTLILKEPE